MKALEAEDGQTIKDSIMKVALAKPVTQEGKNRLQSIRERKFGGNAPGPRGSPFRGNFGRGGGGGQFLVFTQFFWQFFTCCVRPSERCQSFAPVSITWLKKIDLFACFVTCILVQREFVLAFGIVRALGNYHGDYGYSDDFGYDQYNDYSSSYGYNGGYGSGYGSDPYSSYGYSSGYGSGPGAGPYPSSGGGSYGSGGFHRGHGPPPGRGRAGPMGGGPPPFGASGRGGFGGRGAFGDKRPYGGRGGPPPKRGRGGF